MGELNDVPPPPTPEQNQPPPTPPPIPPPSGLIRSSYKKGKQTKVFRVVRSVFRSFPIMSQSSCKIVLPSGHLPDGHRGTNCVTGTLYGYKNGRVSLAIQENPKTAPIMILELELKTDEIQNEMNLGMVRIALECEKQLDKDNKVKLLEEPLWTMFFNGKKGGLGVKRDATEDDLNIIELLRSVSMGAGMLPGKSDVEGPDGEIAYMRAHFDRVVGSKDSETLYMLSPDGNNGPELSIFFVRI
ncbi:protein MIZU-KUSSEI 1-like [Rutidosis leptorrhynchoides]|uniref:protein MIZU-KUSSEI 1-like n=1 Tax=Rutidosis leptorrhynchoides TaxID=125765 RepID=UPI003A996D56